MVFPSSHPNKLPRVIKPHSSPAFQTHPTASSAAQITLSECGQISNAK